MDKYCTTCHMSGPHSPSVEDGVRLVCVWTTRELAEGAEIAQLQNERLAQEYANRANAMLDDPALPEFGERRRLAIVDTACMLAYDDGVMLDDAQLAHAARSLA